MESRQDMTKCSWKDPRNLLMSLQACSAEIGPGSLEFIAGVGGLALQTFKILDRMPR